MFILSVFKVEISKNNVVLQFCTSVQTKYLSCLLFTPQEAGRKYKLSLGFAHYPKCDVCLSMNSIEELHTESASVRLQKSAKRNENSVSNSCKCCT